MAKTQENVTWLGKKKSRQLSRVFGVVLFLLGYWSDNMRLIAGIVLLVFGLAILAMAGLSIVNVAMRLKLKSNVRKRAKRRHD